MIDVASKPPIKPEYMGEGLYASFDGYQIRLFTPQGNEVFLEPPVYDAVRAYGAKI